MGQDNEAYRDRIRDAVVEAVIQASRPHPNASTIEMNMNAALEGICRAMATIASTMPQMVDDRETGVEIMTGLKDWTVQCMEFLIEQVREGRLPQPPSNPPSLRLVK